MSGRNQPSADFIESSRVLIAPPPPPPPPRQRDLIARPRDLILSLSKDEVHVRRTKGTA